jgi:hypothetical protein
VAERLLVSILGNRNSGKTYTWNTLFGKTVKTGKNPRHLELLPGECVETFLVSGSFEERNEYAGDVLDEQDCRIILCSMQYTEEVHKTLAYLVEQNFYLYVQWLNPGRHDGVAGWDRLGLVNQILSARSVMAIRDGQTDATSRVEEVRQFIYGWARYRDLIIPC